MSKSFALLFQLSTFLLHSANVSTCPVVASAPLYWGPNGQASAPRFELRQCGGTYGSLVLTVWSQHADKPDLAFDTSDFGVAQTFIKENILVLVTSGAARDQVFVVQFKNGHPELLLRQVTKGQLNIYSHDDHLTLTITGIFAGDAPARTRTVELKPDFRQLIPSATQPK